MRWDSYFVHSAGRPCKKQWPPAGEEQCLGSPDHPPHTQSTAHIKSSTKSRAGAVLHRLQVVRDVLQTECLCPQHSYTEAWALVWCVWRWGLWETIHSGEAMRVGPHNVKRKRNTRALFLGSVTVKRWPPRKSVLTRNWTCTNLICNFQPPELWEVKSLLSKSPSLWYFIRAVQAHCISRDWKKYTD